jgi:hypothetical protein
MTWQKILDEYDEEIARFTNVELQSASNAIHFDASEKDKAVQKQLREATLKHDTAIIQWPYVAGIEDALRDALQWMKSPLPLLRDGLLQLADGGMPENLPLVVKLYGDFKEHLGVLYARHPDYVAFLSQRKSGESPNRAIRRYAASYMLAVMRRDNGNISHGINSLRDHTNRIVRGEEAIPEGMQKEQFEKLLAAQKKTKLGEATDRYRDLRERMMKELTEPKLMEWADELLIKAMQYNTLRP